MPADIRSFFGGKPAQLSQENGPAKVEAKRPKGRKRRVIDDDDDDDDEGESQMKKSTPRKAQPKKQAKPAPPTGIETTSADYFGTHNKPKRSEPMKTKAAKTTKTEASAKANGAAGTKVTSRPGPRHNLLDLDDLDNDDDIFSADFKKSGKVQRDDYEEGTEGEDEPIAPRKQARGNDRQAKPTEDVDMKDFDPDGDFVLPDGGFVLPDDDEAAIVDKPAKPGRKRGGSTKKRKSDDLEDDDDEATPKKGKGKRAASNKSTPAKKKPKKEDIPENAEMQAIFDSIPTVRPPTPPPQTPNKKFNFAAYAGHATAQPVAAGAKERPIGAENCLAGLTFVFTGVLDTLGREEGQSLVKQYGGRVTTAPSKNTSYVVLGNDAGPKKLHIIREHSLKTINEDGLYELIRRLPANGGDSKAAAKYTEKKQKEENKIKEMAAQIDQEEKKARKQSVTSGVKAAAIPKGKSADHPANGRLLTVKYAPTQLAQICGNKGQVEKLQNWLRAFPKSRQRNFKMAGKDGSGVFRAVILSGPPGIGKTTAAHLVAKLEGYDIVETNASDTRSKKLVEEGLRGILSTTSLLGYFAGDGQKAEASRKKLVLIMDEVDGMSAGDRGGVGALASICKKSDIPIILICNDRKLPKMRPFDHVTYDLPFRRPTLDQIRSRIMTIVYREGLKLPTNVVNALIEGSGADIRQVVNMISAAKLDQEAMDFDKGKQMSKAWEKHIVLKPWDITNKILGGGMFAPSSAATLNDKIELYFNDHEFSFLMLQENYLGTNPIPALNFQGRDKNLKILELVEKASESISDGDLVDRMIHGSQQQWSLMPTHAVFSFVRPASFVAGSLAGHQTRFTSWLGKNSTQGKLARMVKEIQGHMRLRSSGDRHEIRQQYVPLLWQQLVRRLEVDGKDAVPEIIELMDSYFLTKDDFDAIMELGVGPMDTEKLRIQPQAKAMFTRKYNEQSHPLPFMKASHVVAPKKTAKDKPDLEEALEESDEGEVVDEAAEAEEDETDLSKDKYIKAPKKKKAAANSKAGDGKGKGKRSKKAADDGADEEEDEPPTKKGKGKAKAKK